VAKMKSKSDGRKIIYGRVDKWQKCGKNVAKNEVKKPAVRKIIYGRVDKRILWT
jgi:hypothetical protein